MRVSSPPPRTPVVTTRNICRHCQGPRGDSATQIGKKIFQGNYFLSSQFQAPVAWIGASCLGAPTPHPNSLLRRKGRNPWGIISRTPLCSQGLRPVCPHRPGKGTLPTVSDPDCGAPLSLRWPLRPDVFPKFRDAWSLLRVPGHSQVSWHRVFARSAAASSPQRSAVGLLQPVELTATPGGVRGAACRLVGSSVLPTVRAFPPRKLENATDQSPPVPHLQAPPGQVVVYQVPRDQVQV